jgi:pyridoxamine 5'-phosphate oxidase
MISFTDLSKTDPYIIFKSFYDRAIQAKQNNIEAISISSYDKENSEVESRLVNLKYIHKNKWIFFTNYSSPKALQFKNHNQISAIFFWQTINVQIRIKARISKTSSEFSDKHFHSRVNDKNALAISSNQSKKIDSYDDVISKYKTILNDAELLKKRPSNWGGYEFIPYYFEFWEGNELRLNRRKCYEYIDDKWISFFLQP